MLHSKTKPQTLASTFRAILFSKSANTKSKGTTQKVLDIPLGLIPKMQSPIATPKALSKTTQ